MSQKSNLYISFSFYFGKWSRLASTCVSSSVKEQRTLQIAHPLCPISGPFLYDTRVFYIGKCMIIKRNFEQLCSWFRFLLALSSQPLSSKQGVCKAPSGRCTGEVRTNPLVKTSLFLFLCRSEMYSYHRNKIYSIWHMQGKVTTVVMQVFFPSSFSKCSRKQKRNQTSVLFCFYFSV